MSATLLRKPILLAGILFLLSSTAGCSLFILSSNLTPEDYLPRSLLIVADENIYDDTAGSIEIYRKDLSAEGISSELLIWRKAADCTELKITLQSYGEAIDGAVFIGNIPAAYYEQSAFGVQEKFPTDIFYMDTDSVWSDRDGDGILDEHSELEAEIFTSRIPGTSEEINSYLIKLHNYRNGNPETPVFDGAFIFKDDDWHYNYRSNDFGLKSIYNNVNFYEDHDDTTKYAYLNRMTSTGSEYVYQWIHANPSALFFDIGDSYQVMGTEEIINNNTKGNFYNLFDCRAALFTVDSLAQNYLTRTDSCIAVLGSTKTGGVYYPVEFHKAIGFGACWGAAYKSWYNIDGRNDDLWFLGIIIMGDPAIRPFNGSGADIAGGSRSISGLIPVSEEELDGMFHSLQDFERDYSDNTQ